MNHPTPPVFLHDRELAPLGLWTPETNRIHTDMLTPDERIALGAAKHGWLFWNDSAKAWQDKITNDAYLYPGSIYRAKSAPVPTLDAMAALKQLYHAVCGETGFAQAVRDASGFQYPWPALDAAEEAAAAVIGAHAMAMVGLKAEGV